VRAFSNAPRARLRAICWECGVVNVMPAHDALKNGDRDGNGTIELSELVAHVQDQVPKIAAQLSGVGRAAVALRGSTDGSPSARFGSKGEDFTLTQRLQ
jgi:hypothetical protein